jgi:hypothetical protein
MTILDMFTCRSNSVHVLAQRAMLSTGSMACFRRVGSLFSMTGPGAHIGQAMSRGALTGVDQVNESGGVEGYKFGLIITYFKNTDVNLAVTGLRKMISIDKILIHHMKELMLHTNLSREDTIFYFTTCGWMMWNWLVSSLSLGPGRKTVPL